MQEVVCTVYRVCVMCAPEQVMEESAGVSADGVSVLQYDSV